MKGPSADDFRDADLGDPRRNRRLHRFAMAMAARPEASLPMIARSEAELEGMYRLLNSPGVTFAEVLEAHQARVVERAEAAGNTVVVHDTTSFEFPHLDPRDVGFLQTGKAGFYAHVSLVVKEDEREPLGVAALSTNFRAQRRRRKSRNESGKVTTKRPDRESKRWEDGVEASARLLASCAAPIHVADRESDSYQLLALMVRGGHRFVFRVRHDRPAQAVDDSGADWSKLRALVGRAEWCAEREVPLSPRRGATAPRQARAFPKRKARLAQLRFAATRLRLRRPKYFGDEVPETIDLNVVRVYEVDVPDGENPVEWILFTTEPIDSVQQITRVVDIYRTRWVVEEFFKALKTGCVYEERQLESRHALLNMLAISLPIACQLLWLRSQARQQPEAPATKVFTQRQIAVLRELSRKRLPEMLTVRHAMAAVAELGGHWRSNGEPGWQVLRRGLECVLGAEVGWVLRENARKDPINR